MRGHAASAGFEPHPGARPAIPGPARSADRHGHRRPPQSRRASARSHGDRARARNTNRSRRSRWTTTATGGQADLGPALAPRRRRRGRGSGAYRTPPRVRRRANVQRPAIRVERAPRRRLAARGAVDGPLAPLRIVKILIQCCASLAEARAIGTLHRDVKPDNVFLVDLAGSPDFVKLWASQSPASREIRQSNVPVPFPSRPEAWCLDARSDLRARYPRVRAPSPARRQERPLHLLSGAPAMPDSVPYVVRRVVRRALKESELPVPVCRRADAGVPSRCSATSPRSVPQS